MSRQSLGFVMMYKHLAPNTKYKFMHHDRMLIQGVNGVFGLSPYLVVMWLLHLFQSLSPANPDLSCLGTTGEGISSRWSTLSWDIPSDLMSSQTPDFPGTTPLDCDSRPSSGADTPNSSIINLCCFELQNIFVWRPGPLTKALGPLKYLTLRCFSKAAFINWEGIVINHCSTVF